MHQADGMQRQHPAQGGSLCSITCCAVQPTARGNNPSSMVPLVGGRAMGKGTGNNDVCSAAVASLNRYALFSVECCSTDPASCHLWAVAATAHLACCTSRAPLRPLRKAVHRKPKSQQH